MRNKRQWKTYSNPYWPNGQTHAKKAVLGVLYGDTGYIMPIEGMMNTEKCGDVLEKIIASRTDQELVLKTGWLVFESLNIV